MTGKLMLFSENFTYALLLDSIKEACATTNEGEVNSWGRPSYARALRELGLCGFVDLQTEDEDSIIATINEKGNAYLVQLLKEEEEERAARKR